MSVIYMHICLIIFLTLGTTRSLATAEIAHFVLHEQWRRKGVCRLHQSAQSCNQSIFQDFGHGLWTNHWGPLLLPSLSIPHSHVEEYNYCVLWVGLLCSCCFVLELLTWPPGIEGN